MQRDLRVPVLAAVLVAAACISTPAPPPHQPPPTRTAPTPVEGSAPDSTGAAEDPEVTSPETITPPPAASPDEIATLLPPTPVTTAPSGAVRASVLERQEFVLECFRRYGFEGEIDPMDLSIGFETPPEQQERFWEVNQLCLQEEFEWLGYPLGKNSPEELRRHYRAYLYVRECMIAEGYPVDDPPSLEAYVESGGEIWHPYDALMQGGEGSPTFFTKLEQICPQDLFYLLQVLDLDD